MATYDQRMPETFEERVAAGWYATFDFDAYDSLTLVSRKAASHWSEFVQDLARHYDVSVNLVLRYLDSFAHRATIHTDYSVAYQHFLKRYTEYEARKHESQATTRTFTGRLGGVTFTTTTGSHNAVRISYQNAAGFVRAMDADQVARQAQEVLRFEAEQRQRTQRAVARQRIEELRAQLERLPAYDHHNGQSDLIRMLIVEQQRILLGRHLDALNQDNQTQEHNNEPHRDDDDFSF